MYITPLNNQSFTGFRLKDGGAKALAEIFVDKPDYEKAFIRNIINPLKKVKTEVIYDGRDVFVKNEFGKRLVKNYAEPDEFGLNKYSVFKVKVQDMSDKKRFRNEDYYIDDGGSGARKTLKNSENTSIPAKFFAAKEIAKYEDDILFPNSAEKVSVPTRENLIDDKITELKIKYAKKPQ